MSIQNGGSTAQKSQSGIGKNHIFFILRRPTASGSITLFWQQLTGVKVLDEYLYNLSLIKTK
jgi:hypothetical protein